ncbi:MAG: saccharopine dehydrogenase NADP-binding domain-containing protein [Candidatus Cloacimonetes bacterium]|nr:saccharopine dehydrogenase NADP-binding domain-containing protein [Candidatus Cloacimonadota bacterium]MBS3767789.1 saccharopine dehydrogenase NADP-binding domain-containing protein [Candidatus Cloacimonadota bacterium]
MTNKQEDKTKKKVLILGAGLVSKPHVEYLLDQPNFLVTVASRTVSKAEKLVKGHPRGKAISLNVKDDEKLSQLISEHDLAVSLLPYVFHPKVAKECIKHEKHMVTTSYVSDEMKALDKEAKEAGVMLLNEIGVDPGIDHMSAMKIIDMVKDKGGKIKSFRSYCGGLPAPEANTNPWGYKFSWSPRGVIKAGKNPARYLEDNEIVKIPGPELFANHWEVDIPDFGKLEAYPNRDSVPYKDIYNIEDTDTMFRGTLRYPGWSETMKYLADLGMLDDDREYDLTDKTYGEFMQKLVAEDKYNEVKKNLAKQWNISTEAEPIKRLEWLGMFGNEKIKMEAGTAMDVFCKILLDKLEYEPGERDMLVMHHEFEAEYPQKKQHITSTMIDFGIPNGDSSMSRTVGLPAAIGVKMILNGVINETGVHIPVTPEIYEPVLEELENMDITFEERFNNIDK